MKILVLGAHGVIGRAVVKALTPRHEVLSASRNSGAHAVDARDAASLRRMLESVGRVNAIVTVLGDVHWGPLADMTQAQFRLGVEGKLMAQVNTALVGQHFLEDGGSVTLTGGVLAEQPIRWGTNASTVNSALEGFVRGAAVELPRGLRINVVSPGPILESWDKVGPLVPGWEPVPADRVALAYVRSVEGAQTGQVLRVF